MLISMLFQYNLPKLYRIQTEKENKEMKGHDEAEDAAV